MNTTSASPAESSEAVGTKSRILVWDLPVRVFHWLTVLSFAGAYLTAESERWRLVHVTLGYTLAGLVLFRILWGLVGTRYARFSDFVRSPSAAARYLGAMVHGRAKHYIGHNPAGALAILALLGLSLVVTAAGWASFNEVGGEWLEELHEIAANLMLAVVGVHVAGVAAGSWLHRENLVGAMVTGHKTGRTEQGIRKSWRIVAVLMLAAVVGFWWLQWHNAPSAADASASVTFGSHRDRDDD